MTYIEYLLTGYVLTVSAHIGFCVYRDHKGMKRAEEVDKLRVHFENEKKTLINNCEIERSNAQAARTHASNIELQYKAIAKKAYAEGFEEGKEFSKKKLTAKKKGEPCQEKDIQSQA